MRAIPGQRRAPKSRGAFFTPPQIASFVANWAVRSREDLVLEPSAGDAEFLVHAVSRLQAMGVPTPHVHGVELHKWSASVGATRVEDMGGSVDMAVGDFFDAPADARYTAVVGNPRTSGSRTSPVTCEPRRARLPSGAELRSPGWRRRGLPSRSMAR